MTDHTTPSAATGIDLDADTLWEIHGVVKNAGSISLAHKIADALARRSTEKAEPLSSNPAGLSSNLPAGTGDADERARFIVNQRRKDAIPDYIDDETIMKGEITRHEWAGWQDRAALAQQSAAKQVGTIVTLGGCWISGSLDSLEGVPDGQHSVYLAAPVTAASAGEKITHAMITAGKAAYHDHYWPKFGMTEHTWEVPSAALLAKLYRAMKSAAAPCSTRAAPAAQPVPDHVIRETVNRVRDVAAELHAHGSLRERIAAVLVPVLKGSAAPAAGEQEKAAIADVIGCFKAAEVEGLSQVLAETSDDRLKDLVERRLMHALYAAQGTATPTTEQAERDAPVSPAIGQQGVKVLTTLLEAAGAKRWVRCHDGSGEPFAAYDKDIADRVVAELRAEMHVLKDAAPTVEQAERDARDGATVPPGVYYAFAHDNFYGPDGKGMGTDFYLKWRDLRNDFPQSAAAIDRAAQASTTEQGGDRG